LFIPCYVYIIQSGKDGQFYKGFSENPAVRLLQHNNGETKSTRLFVPWKLIYVELMPSNKDALIRAKNLKKATRERIAALIKHPKKYCRQLSSWLECSPVIPTVLWERVRVLVLRIKNKNLCNETDYSAFSFLGKTM